MFKSLKSRLIILIFVYLSIVILWITIGVYQYYSKEIHKQSERYFIEKIDNYVEQVDNVLLMMDTVSAQLLSSNTLQAMFFEANKSTYRKKNYFEHNLEEKKIAQDILWGYNSPYSLVDNVNIYGASSYIGLRYSPSVEKIQSFRQFYTMGMKMDEVKYVYRREGDPLDEVNQNPVISLIRPFIATNYGFVDIGKIEVQKNFSRIEAISYNEPSSGFKTIIIDDEGGLIYSDFEQRDTLKGSEIMRKIKENAKNSLFDLEVEQMQYSVAYSVIDRVGWNIILLQPKVIFLEPIHQMLQRLIGIILVITLIVFVILAIIAEGITRPLNCLVHTIDHLDLNSIPRENRFKVVELERIQRAFIRLTTRLNDSAKQLVIANETELELRVMAMQAQINPHFLYNALTAISSVASDENNEKVPIMCYQLSEIFRYTSTSSKTTTLQDEIQNIRNYMEFAKWRYEDNFSFSISETGALQNVELPRLILQPFVENCFSHGFQHVYPIYKIKVEVVVNKNGWSFTLCDNGSGFEKKVLEGLRVELKKIDMIFEKNNQYERLEANGKAILNVYIRLKLIYKSNIQFVIENAKQGAIVQIVIKEGEEDV